LHQRGRSVAGAVKERNRPTIEGAHANKVCEGAKLVESMVHIGDEIVLGNAQK
jgi:hypothetical protein